MGGLRNYGYKVNNGITYKRKRLKKLSKTIKLLSHCILKIDIDFPDDFGWKTPNGDFKNDNFNVSVLNYTDFEMNIHNYYGTKLFSTTDPSIGWDGTYKGRSVQE